MVKKKKAKRRSTKKRKAKRKTTRKAKRSRKQIQAAKRNIKKAQKASPAAKARPNVYTNGREYDVEKGSVQGFMRTHNKAQRIYMHAILHSPAGRGISHSRRKALHTAIVKRDLKGGLQEHKTPLR